MTRYAIIGLGYVAPKHLQAIENTGGEVVAACDPHDSVGVLDRYFPDCEYFPEIERFERHLDKLRRVGHGADYVSICSPSYLHDAHCRLALRNGAHAICEKPLVIKPRNAEALIELERETNRRVFPVLQLRHSERLAARRDEVSQIDGRLTVNLDYVTYRGPWYDRSWKGAPRRSGGLVANIGIHLFDLLLWMFGPWRASPEIRSDGRTAEGILRMERADVAWRLSLEREAIPQAERHRSAYRRMDVVGHFMETLEDFGDLHTSVYEAILGGQGLAIADVLPSLELVHMLHLQAQGRMVA